MKAYEYSFVIKRGDGVADVFPVEFVRSFRAKSIKITPQLAKKIIRITYPVYVRKSVAVNFLDSKKDWVIQQLEKVPETVKICEGAKISLLGKEYKIFNVPDARRGVWIEDSYIFVSGDLEFLNLRVKEFVKKEVRKYISQKAHFYAKKLDVSFEKITIKDTVSRWGSCASNGHLSFSWRLAFAPIFVIDYVVAHEVAHLRELNHSYKFWNTVAVIYEGNVNDAQNWLSRYGISLYAIE